MLPWTNYSFYLNTFAGHGSLIGKESGKIIGVGTRLMNCRVCSTSSVKKTREHDRRLNWGGSSKGMEGNLAVEILNTTKARNYRISTLIYHMGSVSFVLTGDQIIHYSDKTKKNFTGFYTEVNPKILNYK